MPNISAERAAATRAAPASPPPASSCAAMAAEEDEGGKEEAASAAAAITPRAVGEKEKRVWGAVASPASGAASGAALTRRLRYSEKEPREGADRVKEEEGADSLPTRRLGEKRGPDPARSSVLCFAMSRSKLAADKQYCGRPIVRSKRGGERGGRSSALPKHEAKCAPFFQTRRPCPR